MRDRSRSGVTVPPEGLYLVALEYPDPTASLEGNFNAIGASVPAKSQP
jgi:hypothetical protein